MSEVVENKVVPMNPDQTVIQLDPADALQIAESAGKMSLLYAEIGQTHVLYERAMKKLMSGLEEAEQEYGTLGKALARKYVKDRGQYTLDPEIGAFIGMKTPQKQGE